MNTIESIGSIADITAIFFHELIKDGIKEEAATILTAKFVEVFVGSILVSSKEEGK